MRKSITQEFGYGCGIACFAFALDMTYKQAAALLGSEQAKSNRFWVKDFASALNKAGKAYAANHVNSRHGANIYAEGTIVLIRRSKRYPTGHYLIRHDGFWMDPWINVANNNDIAQAKSGYRKRLPGKPMYVLVPVT